MQLDLLFFGWLIPSLQFITHFHSISVWGVAICHIRVEIRVLFHRAWCELIILIADITWVQNWLKHACKSRNPSLTDWRSVFKAPRKDSALKPADTHSVHLLIHPCVASSLFVWLESWKRCKDLFSSLCICFPSQTNKLCEAFPSIIIPL